jgi:hypothetical protein
MAALLCMKYRRAFESRQVVPAVMEARMNKFLATRALGATLALMALPAVAAGGEGAIPADFCAPAVERRINEMKLNRSDIDRIGYVTVWENRPADNDRLRGIDAWVYYKAGGALIVDMNRDCSVRQVYTRGVLRLPNVKSF